MCNRYRSDRSKYPVLAHRLGVGLPFNEISEGPRDIYPDKLADVVVRSNGGAELTEMRWGFPPPPNLGTRPVTNVRNLSSSYWRGWLKPEWRCLVPASAFSEYDERTPKGAKVPRWFGADAPMFCFAGIWRPWIGVRGTRAEQAAMGAVEHRLFAFLTCAPNAVVAPVHGKAMPVIVPEDRWAEWLDAPVEDAVAMAQPFPPERMTLLNE